MGEMVMVDGEVSVFMVIFIILVFMEEFVKDQIFFENMFSLKQEVFFRGKDGSVFFCVKLE